jgi:hypothetical protein
MPNFLSDAEIDKIVQQTIPQNTDASHSNAIVATVDTDGAKVVAHFQKDVKNGWQLDADAVAEHDWTGDNSVGAQVVLKW